VDTHDTEDAVTKIQQWRKLAGVEQPQDFRTFLRVAFKDVLTSPGEDSRRMTSHDVKIVERWLEWIVTEKRKPNPSDSYDILSVDLERTRLSVTRQGLLGTGPPKLRRGDRIVIAKGSRVPLVLRPVCQSSVKNWSPRLVSSGMATYSLVPAICTVSWMARQRLQRPSGTLLISTRSSFASKLRHDSGAMVVSVARHLHAPLA